MLIRKFIIRSGKTSIGYDGEFVDFPDERLRGWAQRANEMIKGAVGYAFSISAPPKHDIEAVPHIVGALKAGEEYSFDNLGYWKRFEAVEALDSSGERCVELYGVIDAPDGGLAPKEGESFEEIAKTDPNRISAFLNTPAGKLHGTNGEDAVVKTVSLRTYDEFTDARGRKWKDVIVHVSPCIHPAITDQKPFQRIDGPTGGIALSVALAASAVAEAVSPDKPDPTEEEEEEGAEEVEDSVLIARICQKNKSLGVFVTPGDDLRKFAEALDIALTQVTGGDMNDLNDPTKANSADPNDSVPRRGVAMSVGVTDPAKTDPPVTAPVVTPPAFNPEEFKEGIMLSVARDTLAPTIKANCERRLAVLVEAGLPKETAAKLQPHIDAIGGVSLSVARQADGSYKHTPTSAEEALGFVEETMKGVILSASQMNGPRGSDGAIHNPSKSNAADFTDEAIDDYFVGLYTDEPAKS